MANEPYLSEIARQAASEYGDRAAYMTADGWPLSFADLDLAADEIALGVGQPGCRRGLDACFSFCRRTWDYVATNIAACRVGGDGGRNQPSPHAE